MKKTFLRVFAAVMAAAMLPVAQLGVLAEEAAPVLVVNESFDSYTTNDQPGDFNVQARNWFITEHDKEDKGLLIYAGNTGAGVKFPAAGTGDTVISFDLKATDKMPAGQLNVYDSGGRVQKLMDFTEGKGAGVINGFPVSGFGKSKITNYVIVYRPVDKTFDVYVNGVRKAANKLISNVLVKEVASVEFVFTSEKAAQGVIIDNVNVYGDNEYSLREFPRAEYNSEALDTLEVEFGKRLGSAVLCNEGFESGNSLSIAQGGNDYRVVEDSQNPDNKVFRMDKTSPSDSYINGKNLPINVDSIVYEFDIRVIDPMSVANITFKDSNGLFDSIGNIGQGAQFAAGSSLTKFKLNQWVRISIIKDYYDRTNKVFVNGEQVALLPMVEGFGTNGASIDSFRIHQTHYAVKGTADTDPSILEVDNMRVYEGTELIAGDLGEITRDIDVETKKSVFKSDSAYAKLLEGYDAIHASSGTVIAGGEKKQLEYSPIKKGTHDFLLPVESLAEAFGVPVTVNGTSVTFNGKSMTGEIHDGVVFVDEMEAINAFGKIVTNIPSTYNANGYILGSMSFKMPDDQEQIDEINNYVMYLRPSKEKIAEIYQASDLAGVHPRVQFTQEDFDRVKELSLTDENMIKWRAQVISDADATLTAELPKHELYDGLRMNCQRMFSKDIHVLALAWHLTGDQKYVDRAYAEMETIAHFSDWNPNHHLDTCEMMAAYGVGYDWLYHAFTPEQREVLEKGMLNNGFYDSWLGYQSTSSMMQNAFPATNNHGTVDNGGVLVAAYAFMDSLPKESAYLMANALRGMELNIYRWAPEGIWYEGAGYWELTMQFTAKFLSTLNTGFKNDFGFNNLEGMDKTTDGELQMQTNVGIYNFADSTLNNVYVPEMFYIANIFNLPGIHKAVIDSTDCKWADPEDRALGMLWYNQELALSETSMDLDYVAESIDTMVMRNSWDTKEPAYVGIHGGETIIDHGQFDGGSFIFEHSGVRWAIEMGMGDYNSAGYWDNIPNGQRYDHYRMRAEGHSTIFTSPSQEDDHMSPSTAELTVVQQKPRGVIATIDMTNLLRDVSKAERGFAFTDNRETLVVRDELTLSRSTDVVWTMITYADGVIDEANKTVTLTQDGRTMVLHYETSSPADVTYEVAQALPTSPVQNDNFVPGKAKMVRIRMNGVSGDQTITVKMDAPTLTNVSDISEWNKPISSWNIPDGEIPEKPTVDYITVNGVALEAGTSTSVKANIVEGEFATPPVPTATSDKYDVQITPAASFNESAKVILTDRNDPTNKNVYSVVYNVIKKPVQFDGRESIAVRDFEVSATPQEENPGINMFDGDKSTRWSADGAGNWIQVDLGSVQRIDDIVMAFMSGNVRKTKLTFAFSEDGNTWVQTWDGMSSGTTEDYEFFPTGGINARYVKIGCNGNTEGGANWNSITELVFTKNN